MNTLYNLHQSHMAFRFFNKHNIYSVQKELYMMRSQIVSNIHQIYI